MRTTRSVLASAWCVLLAGCSVREMTTGRAEAEKAVSEFHESFNAGRFAEIYDAASDEFRAALKRERFLELVGAIQRKLGKVTGTENKGWRVNSRNLRTYVDLTQASRFDTGEAVETFSFVVRDGKAILIGYNIQSLDLIVR